MRLTAFQTKSLQGFSPVCHKNLQDEVIQSFEARYAEAQSEAVSYKAQLDTALAALDNSQLRVGELVDARAKLRRQLQASEAAAEQAAAAAKAEVAQLQVFFDSTEAFLCQGKGS